jgi:hypothetical protein
MYEKLDSILNILCCSRTKSPLRRVDNILFNSAGDQYPVINGKPILVNNLKPLHTNQPDKNIISQNIREYKLRKLCKSHRIA